MSKIDNQRRQFFKDAESGLRLGWIAAKDEIIQKLVQINQAYGFTGKVP